MNEPEWSDFKVLTALARGGSVAGAARLLVVDHSTVSRRLSALEDSVGACLVVRGGRELGWTAEGRTLLAAAETVEVTIGQATATVRAAKLGANGCVRLSSPSGLNGVLARLLLGLRARHPGLSIELGAENRAVDLKRGEADLALRMFRPTEPDLICKVAFELGWGLYASQAYADAHGLPATKDELSGHTLVAYVTALHGVSGPRWLETHRGCATIAIHVDNTEVAANMIASGTGLGVIPCVIAQYRTDLVRVFDEVVATNTGHIVYHETLRDTARVRVAVDALLEMFATHAGDFSGRASRKS